LQENGNEGTEHKGLETIVGGAAKGAPQAITHNELQSFSRSCEAEKEKGKTAYENRPLEGFHS
jgi:hypothetical protein